MPPSTPVDRLQRINAVFGDGLVTRKGGKISSKDCPILSGVAVRALHRKAQGLELSSLEESLAGIWGAFITDTAEMTEHGKLYTNENILTGIPDIIKKLPLEKAYSWDDMMQDVDQAQDQALLVSNAAAPQVVDLATAGSREAAALGDCNSQVTFYTHSGTESAEPAAAAAASGSDSRVYNICLDKFECVRKADDSIFNEDNEIYWCYAATEGLVTQNYVTGVYEGIVSGSVRWFNNEGTFHRTEEPTGTYPLLWSGQMDSDTVVTAHIECWEQDDGGSQWKQVLQKAMLDTSKAMMKASNLSRAKGRKGVDYAAILAAVTAALALILEALKNPDDCVLKRTIILDYSALDSLWKQSYRADQWHFDGGDEGYHKLTLRYLF